LVGEVTERWGDKATGQKITAAAHRLVRFLVPDESNFLYGEQEIYPQISGINADFLIGENLR